MNAFEELKVLYFSRVIVDQNLITSYLIKSSKTLKYW